MRKPRLSPRTRVLLRGAVRNAHRAPGYLVGERLQALIRYHEQRLAYDRSRMTMGRASYGEPLVATFPGDTARVDVGSFTAIALDVVLMAGGDHRVDWVTTFPLRACLGLPGAFADGNPFSRGDIKIGNDVWIGRGARVLSGVTVGDGAVIGGYSVVAKDVRPYAIVVGNPAREIRRRFTDAQIELLQAIAWWDWPMEKIVACVHELCDPDIDGFIAHHRPRTPAPSADRDIPATGGTPLAGAVPPT